MVRDSAMVTMGSVQETNIALTNGTIDTPYDLLLHQKLKMGLKCTHRDMLNFKWRYLRNG